MELYVPRKRLWSPTEGRGRLVAPSGEVLWESEWIPNALADEGEENILNVWLREQAHLTKYLALLTAAPSETTTMATMTELGTGVGYSRQQILAAEWGAPALDAGDMQSAAPEKSFGPASSSNWTLTHVALVTTASGTGGKFLSFLAVSGGPLTVPVGISYKYTLRAKLQ
jgi:hypothetical protein